MINKTILLLIPALAVLAAADDFSAPEFSKPFTNPADDPALPRVLLIGDSISILYTTTVRRELHGRANVHRAPENCAYSAKGVEQIEKWIGDGKWDIIHFNFGLWDWYGWKQEQRATPESYAANLKKIVKVLKSTNAKLIFATTTPPCDEAEHKIKVLVTEKEAKAFNDAAIAVMKANGVAINDLYNCISVDRAKFTLGRQDVHWNDAGNKMLGRQVAAAIADSLGLAAADPEPAAGFTWKSAIPDDCPFEPSKTLTGVHFTGRHSDYKCGDTFYPSWASDGNLYSPWTDGHTDGVYCGSGGNLARGFRTGHAAMTGDDPLKLVIRNTSPPKRAMATPYRGRYPCGSLVHDGIWYYGTYCLGPSTTVLHEGFKWGFPNLGPMPGFHISRDLGKTWQAPPTSPENPLFPEPAEFLDPVKMGAPHFVDFGRNMEHSPDGKAYLVAMGAELHDPKPRPCIKPGPPGTAYEINEHCEDSLHLQLRPAEAADEALKGDYLQAFKQVEGKPFAHANLSWITADQVYLARVTPSPKTINDIKAYEFFAGHDAAGRPLWTDDFAKIKPLLEWNNNMGCVTATWVPGLKKYLMCVTDGWPTVAKMDSYLLEADTITGPWRIVSYMKDFGEQAYFLNFPSKFISGDGRTMWLCYSANYSSGWNGVDLKINPPGGRYGLSLHEVRLLEGTEGTTGTKAAD